MDREAWRAAIHGVAKSRTRVPGTNVLSRQGVKEDGPSCFQLLGPSPFLHGSDDEARWPGDLFSQKQRKAKLRPPVLVRGLLRTCLNS